MTQANFDLARKILLDAIRPALTSLTAGGVAVEQLLLVTAIQESPVNTLIHRQQLGGGPALGLFQMETATHDECWNNYLKFRKELGEKVKQTLDAGQQPLAQAMKVNDRYGGCNVPRTLHASVSRTARRKRYRGNGKLLEGTLQYSSR